MRPTRFLAAASAALLLIPGSAPAQEAKADPPGGEDPARRFVVEAVEGEREGHVALAREIWGLAELGYREEESSALLRRRLADAGFRVETGAPSWPRGVPALP